MFMFLNKYTRSLVFHVKNSVLTYFGQLGLILTYDLYQSACLYKITGVAVHSNFNVVSSDRIFLA